VTRELDVGLLVAAAGFGPSGSFLTAQLDQELEMLAVNCRALLALTWHFGRRFAQRGRGGIVLMSSIVGFQGMPFAAHYAATKAYVQTLAEALSVELAPLGVDVIASAPGPTNSGFAARAGMQMGMALRPEDVAQATLNALGRQPTVLPGLLSKLLVYALVPLPRWVRVRIMGEVMAGMTKHQRAPIANLAEVE
jgi:short-subunit dehydrogenase